MWTHKDITVIQLCVAELMIELNSHHYASIKGKNNARKLESHGYVEMAGKRNKGGDIDIKIRFREYKDGSIEHDKLMFSLSD